MSLLINLCRQVGNILSSQVTYGAIVAPNSTHFLQCFREFIETEEQWLFHVLAEITGTTQVNIFFNWYAKWEISVGKLNQALSFDVSKEGNGKMKNEKKKKRKKKKKAEKWKYITVKLLIELGFKLDPEEGRPCLPKFWLKDYIFPTVKSPLLFCPIVGFHMTSQKVKLKNYPSHRDFTFTMH